MKKVLITGKNSYIGNSLEAWLQMEPQNYQVDQLNMKDFLWKTHDFSDYDTVFHVAGIAHCKATRQQERLYYKVNRDLAIETAARAKAQGVRQFIFISSILVYGNCRESKGIIRRNTVPKPDSIYGKSKLQAERGIKKLETDTFRVVILRAPFIYGKGCKGNYPRISRLARLIPVFPSIDNLRSMLHIDNLCELIKLLIDQDARGSYFPQNEEYIRTTDLVKAIRTQHGKRTYLTRLFHPWIKCLLGTEGVRKVFGTLVYEKAMSEYEGINYQIRSFEKSIELTEKIDLSVRKSIEWKEKSIEVTEKSIYRTKNQSNGKKNQLN